jgi:FixJ family two-component response regulator
LTGWSAEAIALAGDLLARAPLRDVLQQVLLGRLNKQIAYEQGFVEETVKAHRGCVMDSLQRNTGLPRPIPYLLMVARDRSPLFHLDRHLGNVSAEP